MEQMQQQNENLGEQNVDTHETTSITPDSGVVKRLAPAEQTEETYQLPPVTQGGDTPQSASNEEEAAEETLDDKNHYDEIESSSDLDAALEAALTHSTISGTIAHELDFAIHRFRSAPGVGALSTAKIREKSVNEFKYRLEFLRADASDDEAAKIDAIIALL